jgi:S-adenosylmethionine/arginine decarboxylase-like enzyme
MTHLHHLHMLGKAFLKNPPRDVDLFNRWLTHLVEKIEMKTLMGPYSIDCLTVGNEGITGVIVIETSHCSGHVWHAVERPFIMFDVYSCVDYDPQVIIEHLDEYFGVEELHYTIIDRNDIPVVLKTETLIYP